MSHLSSVTNKIVDLNQLLIQVENWKKTNQKVVFTNGCFDILHRGHVEYLAQAADFGSKLIIGVNSDASVKRQGKGDSRPLQDEYSRTLLIAALDFVAAVVVFDDDTPFDLINQLQPNVLIKGGDYDPKCTDKTDKKYIVGSDVVLNNGGAVEVIQFVPGYSTSKIEEKLKRS
ncbi:adenylyltransferase/cytidyltransferase family protein [Vicingus serpentipes]|uniref:Adenylyltransferase/cytidyltransferase family protein n=1 Tax=Vicingus serpentipes TaxID=1926625 RepID=A0A5C6RSP1_9FLAO|nr:adenylyltransferase/cytidyltransferase family protein [Vicingus serpentipes]TXB64660.1 adenylyltransferase/cytidyltransferase family protein [Vicingus serpentipes]